MTITMTPAIQTGVDQGLLKLDQHEGLLERLPHWCRIAGISPDDIGMRLSEWVGPATQDWLKHHKQYWEKGKVGLLMVGPFSRGDQPRVDQRMSAMVAACLRHLPHAYDARMRRMADAVDSEADHPPILLLQDSGGEQVLPIHKAIGTLLINRTVWRLPTVLHVQNLDDVEFFFGSSAASLIRHSYLHIEV